MTDDATLPDVSRSDAERARNGREECAGDDAPSEPPRTTYAWGSYTCDDCGEAADRVWRDGDALVCPACKSW